MQEFVHRLWYQRHPLAYLLLPLSGLFWLISTIRRALFALKLKKQVQLSVPVIVVGNITAGGSGKTPTVIYLIELLRRHGYKPGVISRGYGVKFEGTREVKPTSLASEVGDEPAMIAARTQVPMVVGAKRVDAANALLANYDVDVIICDDGLQHYALGRNIEIAIIDGQRRLGNGWLIPAGPLREGPKRLNSVDFVIANGGEAQSGEFAMALEPDTLLPVAPQAPLQAALQDSDSVNRDNTVNYVTPKVGDKVAAMAAIGNPQRYFDTLTKLGYRVTQQQAFEDHQAFDFKELDDLAGDLPLLMTEKDAVKCREIQSKNWWYLPVNAKLSAEFDQQIIERLTKVAQNKKG